MKNPGLFCYILLCFHVSIFSAIFCEMDGHGSSDASKWKFWTGHSKLKTTQLVSAHFCLISLLLILQEGVTVFSWSVCTLQGTQPRELLLLMQNLIKQALLTFFSMMAKQSFPSWAVCLVPLLWDITLLAGSPSLLYNCFCINLTIILSFHLV